MDPSPSFTVSGTLMYVSVALLFASILWTIVQSVLEAKGRVFPRSLWLMGPIAILTIGILGVGRAMSVTNGPLAPIPADQRQKFIAEGMSVVLNMGSITGLCLFAVGAVASLGLGISTLVRVEDANDDTRKLGTGVIVASGLGTLLCFVLGYAIWDAAPIDYVAPVAVGLAGTGYGLVLLAGREGDADTEFEVTNRAGASLLVLTVIAGVIVTLGINGVALFEALEGVEAGNRASFVADQIAQLAYVGVLTGGPVVLAAAMGGIGVTAAPDPTDSPNWTERLGPLALALLPVFAALAYAGWHYPAFKDRVILSSNPNAAETADEQP